MPFSVIPPKSEAYYLVKDLPYTHFISSLRTDSRSDGGLAVSELVFMSCIARLIISEARLILLYRFRTRGLTVLVLALVRGDADWVYLQPYACYQNMVKLVQTFMDLCTLYMCKYIPT